MKRCTKCGEEKPVSEFPKNGPGKTHPRCSVCNRAAVKAWQEANRERVRETARRLQSKWRAERPDYFSAKHKRWRDKNVEQERARWRAFYAANPEQMLAKKHERRARETGAGGSFTRQEAIDLKASYLGRCAYCFDRPAEHLDHIVAVAAGGDSNIDNITPACAQCNYSKGKRSLLQFMMRKAAV